jgi:hypothetical protein
MLFRLFSSGPVLVLVEPVLYRACAGTCCWCLQ